MKFMICRQVHRIPRFKRNQKVKKTWERSDTSKNIITVIGRGVITPKHCISCNNRGVQLNTSQLILKTISILGCPLIYGRFREFSVIEWQFYLEFKEYIWCLAPEAPVQAFKSVYVSIWVKCRGIGKIWMCLMVIIMVRQSGKFIL